MSDETEKNVDAGSENSGEPAASETVQTDTSDQDAGGSADVEQTQEAVVEETPSTESRTGFAEPGQKAGDECICPDGRKGTVHSFDAGLICIPNADQG
ncbi:MAG TPA: hypothetical protein VHV31_00540 [Nitrolancea sp.]|jgi:hypothetical protein|nr:hypothetical protein [Nitrolancea sp.]